MKQDKFGYGLSEDEQELKKRLFELKQQILVNHGERSLTNRTLTILGTLA